jgi:hypothetical protein
LRVFSRCMPPPRPDRYPPLTITEWIVGAIIDVGLQAVAGTVVAVVGLCACMIVGMPVILVTAGIVLLVFGFLVAIGIWSANRAERAITKERQGENIGSFARAIDRRSEPFDPWVVRAVWDAFSPYANFPLRATDRPEDLGIDPLELDQLLEAVTERSGHSLKNLDKLWESATLGDLVTFVSSQPKRPT